VHVGERFSVFYSDIPTWWTGSHQPNAPKLVNGTILEPGHWVQFSQPALRTRWVDYPPFYLSGRYVLDWTTLPNGARYLLVPVSKQSTNERKST